ncbi:MAG: hypothetical protein TU35_005100 [Thermoproteus sp. AZ2]|uniref:Uncharacterized protein n=1 Tax=Thermoproteus sp. AZ2 TaxID=1609232 RepID=A0ACC6V102_9CREN
MLTPEEKKRFLKALEVDEEFRLAVAGLLGLGEVLRELRELKERMDRFMQLSEERWRENMKRWEESEKRSQESEKRWEEWYESWKKFLEENERRWQENERRWQENEKRWEEQFRFNRWLQSALYEIRDALGGGFEYFAARAVGALLRERGVECTVRVNVTLPVDGFKEVDLFCPEPLVIGEVSVSLRSAEEAEGLLEQLRRSVEAGERLTGRRVYLKVLAVEFAPADVAEHLRRRCEEEGVYLILGRTYERPF